MAYTTINKPNLHFNTVTYTGNGVNPTSITSVGFKPDLLWIKCRSDAVSNLLFDAVRGVSKRLISNSSAAETTETQIASFDTNGWTMDADTSNNGSGRTYVAWNWLGANTTVSNTAGTITSTVSANTTSGFSVVTYTGNGNASATFGHGLGATPKLVIIKNRGDVESWQTFVNNNIRLLLDSTASNYGNYPISTSSTLVTTPSTVDGGWNGNTKTYVAYCFAEVKGFSKIGTYTGNGSTDGTFVYTGFKPAFVIIKRTDSAGYDWLVYDNKRQVEYNVVDDFLKPNLSDAETTGNAGQSLDFLSNGIKFRGTGASSNASGGTYIYMAFAEQPLVGTNNVPATAR